MTLFVGGSVAYVSENWTRIFMSSKKYCGAIIQFIILFFFCEFYTVFLCQIKRCGEMARMLRFFKEQMAKAGLSPSTKLTLQSHISIDDLEV